MRVLHALEEAEVAVLLSGGVDSAACVQFFREVGRPTCALFIDYQQAAVRQEYAAAKALTEHFDVSLCCLRWRGTQRKGQGLVQARNAFLLIGALMECPVSVGAIAIGIHSGTSYADCSAPFVGHIQGLFDLYTHGRVRVVAPFLEWTKAEVWAYARLRGLPLHLTYSCEVGCDVPCGSCLSCLDREAMGD